MKEQIKHQNYYTIMIPHIYYLLKDNLQFVRQGDRLSLVPGLVELPVRHVGEDMVDHVGCEDPATARNEQRSAVLLEQHCILEEGRRHVVSFFFLMYRLNLCLSGVADFNRCHL